MYIFAKRIFMFEIDMKILIYLILQLELTITSFYVRDDGKKVYPCCECEYVAGDFYRNGLFRSQVK